MELKKFRFPQYLPESPYNPKIGIWEYSVYQYFSGPIDQNRGGWGMNFLQTPTRHCSPMSWVTAKFILLWAQEIARTLQADVGCNILPQLPEPIISH